MADDIALGDNAVVVRLSWMLRVGCSPWQGLGKPRAWTWRQERTLLHRWPACAVALAPGGGALAAAGLAGQLWLWRLHAGAAEPTLLLQVRPCQCQCLDLRVCKKGTVGACVQGHCSSLFLRRLSYKAVVSIIACLAAGKEKKALVYICPLPHALAG